MSAADDVIPDCPKSRSAIAGLAAAVSLALALAGVTDSEGRDYTFTPLLGFPTGINDAGDIVGQFYPTGASSYLRRSSGEYITIALPPPATFTAAHGINNSGLIVGRFTSPAFPLSGGFLTRDGRTFTIFSAAPDPTKNSTQAFGLNDNGDVVGQFNGRGFLTSDLVHFTTFDPPHSFDTQPFGINAAGQIVGRFVDERDAVPDDHGFFKSGGTYTIFRETARLDAINDLGHFVGATADLTKAHGFLLEGDTTFTIDYPGVTRTHLTGINNLGQVVGFAFGGLVGFLATPKPETLVGAVLPASRSVQVGKIATAFATVINSGSAVALGCRLRAATPLAASLSFQATDPQTNVPIRPVDVPIDIPAGASQSFIFSLRPTSVFGPREFSLHFVCDNGGPALILPGVNTLLISGSSSPTPDVVALVSTASGDGILTVPAPGESAAFAVATVNVGTAGVVTASADAGTAALPLTVALCQTNPATGLCISPIGATVTTTVSAGGTPTFAIFATAGGAIPFNPAKHRIFVRFKDAGGLTRGATSVAVRTR
jgi:hypothetical protein